MVIREDYWNYCSRCDMIIDTEDPYEPACNCISEIEDWSNEQLQEEYYNLPRHVRENFRPPDDPFHREKPKGNPDETH